MIYILNFDFSNKYLNHNKDISEQLNHNVLKFVMT